MVALPGECRRAPLLNEACVVHTLWLISARIMLSVRRRVVTFRRVVVASSRRCVVTPARLFPVVDSTRFLPARQALSRCVLSGSRAGLLSPPAAVLASAAPSLCNDDAGLFAWRVARFARRLRCSSFPSAQECHGTAEQRVARKLTAGALPLGLRGYARLWQDGLLRPGSLAAAHAWTRLSCLLRRLSPMSSRRHDGLAVEYKNAHVAGKGSRETG